MRERSRTAWRSVARGSIVYSIWFPGSQKRVHERTGVTGAHGAFAAEDPAQDVERALEIVVDHYMAELVVVLELQAGGAHSAIDDLVRILAPADEAGPERVDSTAAG